VWGNKSVISVCSILFVCLFYSPECLWWWKQQGGLGSHFASRIQMSIGRMRRDDKEAHGWRSRNDWNLPHLWFFPNDEICKGMFDLLHIRLYRLFFRKACRSVSRKKRTWTLVDGGECKDILKNRGSGMDYQRKKKRATDHGLDGGLSIQVRYKQPHFHSSFALVRNDAH